MKYLCVGVLERKCQTPGAVFVRDEIMKHIPFKEAIIADTAGISSLYANDGGIIVAY